MAKKYYVRFYADPRSDHPLLVPFLRQRCLEGFTWSNARTAGRNFTGWLAEHPLASSGVTSVSVDLAQVTSRDLVAYQQYLLRVAKKAYNTARGYCIKIWDWLKYLFLCGHIPLDPTVGAPGLKKRRQKATWRILSDDEVDTFMTAVVLRSDQPLRDLAAFGCLSGLGLRSRELLCMTIDDVDRITNHMTVVGKGGHPRTIPVDGTVREVLYAYLDNARLPAEQSEMLWHLPGHRRLRYPELRARFHRFKRLAGIKDRVDGPHAFRHYFITQQLLKGHHPELVARFVGHSSPRELEPYSHVSNAALRNRLYLALGFDVSKPLAGLQGA